jgi:hypothetical protein
LVELAVGDHLHEESVECDGVTYHKEIITRRVITTCECGNDAFKIVEESGEWFYRQHKKGGDINRTYYVCAKCGETGGAI